MKKVYQIIASFSLSLMVVGASAQMAHNVKAVPGPMPRLASAKQMHVVGQASNGHQTSRVQTMTHIDLEYYNTDATLVGSTAYSTWAPPGFINMRYGVADTGNPASNFNLNHSAIVAFDTLVDVNDFAYAAIAGSVNVDTIFALMGYHNTSGMNDTLVFHIGTVTGKGYPTGTFLTNDTIIVPPHSAALPGYFLDSLYSIYIIPNKGAGYNLTSGTKFTVSIEEYGSKLDTLGPWYGSPSFSCAPYGYAFRTQVGPTMGAALNVNSFMSGFQYYSLAKFGGNGSVLTWPNANGKLYNSGGQFGDYWNTTGCASPNDTGFIYFQDIYIAVGVTYNDNTSVNNLTAQGFSVGQNFPNPFNKNTEIAYNLTKSSDVVFTVYDMTGRELVNSAYSTVAAGQHVINLSANQFTPGIYFYTFNVNGVRVTKRMVITQ